MKKYLKNSLVVLLAGYCGITTLTAAPLNSIPFEVVKDSKPYFRTHKDVLSVNMLSLDESAVQIRVYNAHGTLIHCETLKDQKSLGRMFDFSGAAEGRYRVQVRYKGKTYDSWIHV